METHPLHQKIIDQIMKRRGEKGLTGEELKQIEVEVVFHLAGAAIMQCLAENLIEATDVENGEVIWQRVTEPPADTAPLVTLN